jgi:2-oxoglutarate ferredoxin oxidoreductase subunit beta
MIFGKARDKGIRMKRPFEPEVVALGDGVTEKDLLVHDEKGSAAYAFMLAQMEAPSFPVAIGVIRSVEAPVLEVAMREQIDHVTAQRGPGDLNALIYSGDTWEVR